MVDSGYEKIHPSSNIVRYVLTITMFQCEQLIRQLEEGTLHYQAGCSEEEALEVNVLQHKLSIVRDKGGKSTSGRQEGNSSSSGRRFSKSCWGEEFFIKVI